MTIPCARNNCCWRQISAAFGVSRAWLGSDPTGHPQSTAPPPPPPCTPVTPTSPPSHPYSTLLLNPMGHRRGAPDLRSPGGTRGLLRTPWEQVLWKEIVQLWWTSFCAVNLPLCFWLLGTAVMVATKGGLELGDGAGESRLPFTSAGSGVQGFGALPRTAPVFAWAHVKWKKGVHTVQLGCSKEGDTILGDWHCCAETRSGVLRQWHCTGEFSAARQRGQWRMVRTAASRGSGSRGRPEPRGAPMIQK